MESHGKAIEKPAKHQWFGTWWFRYQKDSSESHRMQADLFERRTSYGKVMVLEMQHLKLKYYKFLGVLEVLLQNCGHLQLLRLYYLTLFSSIFN